MNFLPGWEPGLIIAAGEQETAIAFVNSSVSTGSTIIIPSGVQAGDLLVITHCGSDNDGSPPPNVTPSGFTLATTESQSAGSKFSWRHSVHYKLAVGTEGGTSVNVIQGNDGYLNPDQRSICMQFRRSPSAAGITLGDAETFDNAGWPTIEAATGAAPLVVLASVQLNVNNDGANPNTVTLTPTADGRVDNGGAPDDNVITTLYKLYLDTPQDVDFNTTFGYAGAGMYFSMTV
jgi:hypothetical protein